jgi:hypothetical protein
VQAYEDQRNEGLELDADRVLDAQRRLMDAQLQYFSSRTEYAVALKNVHFEKGSLMAYTQVGILDESAATMGFAEANEPEAQENEPSTAWLTETDGLLRSNQNNLTFEVNTSDVTEGSEDYKLDAQQAGRVSLSMDGPDDDIALQQRVAPTAGVFSDSDRVEPLFVAPPAMDASVDIPETGTAGKVRVDLQPEKDLMPEGFILDLDTFEPATDSP